MKLSQIRPCDSCGGQIAPSFYVVRYSLALFKPQATHQVLGMTQYFDGALELAEAFSPDEQAVAIAMDEEDGTELMVELFLCRDCHAKPVTLAELADRIRNARCDCDTERR